MSHMIRTTDVSRFEVQVVSPMQRWLFFVGLICRNS